MVTVPTGTAHIFIFLHHRPLPLSFTLQVYIVRILPPPASLAEFTLHSSGSWPMLLTSPLGSLLLHSGAPSQSARCTLQNFRLNFFHLTYIAPQLHNTGPLSVHL